MDDEIKVLREGAATERRYSLRPDASTTVHGRFQVVCRICEDCEFFQRGTEARAYASREAKRHEAEGVALPPDTIVVFDVMARLGAPQTWSFTGRVLDRRPKASANVRP